MIKRLSVKVEYRMDAGSIGPPRWKALRARVMMTDAAGRITYGSDLFTPNVTNVDMVVAKSLLELKYVETITFIFDSKLNLPNRSYRNGRLLSLELVS